MLQMEMLEKKCDELRETFLRNALSLPSLALPLKADLSKNSMSKKLKLDCCQVCGLKFDSNTIKSKLKSKGKGKKKIVKMIVYCQGCKSDAPGVSLPKDGAVKKKNLNNDDIVKIRKEVKVVEQKPPPSMMKKSSSFPVLTHRQKQVNRSNRLSKMVAAMEKTEPSKTSTLDAFLSSLG